MSDELYFMLNCVNNYLPRIIAVVGVGVLFFTEQTIRYELSRNRFMRRTREQLYKMTEEELLEAEKGFLEGREHDLVRLVRKVKRDLQNSLS